MASRIWGRDRRDFWNEKEPGQWSESELTTMLTQSPWAKEVRAGFEADAWRSLRGTAGGPGVDGMSDMPMIVRWESAAPIREARHKVWPKETAGHYILSVTGIPGVEPPRSGRREKDERQAGMMARLRESTQLRRKGKDPMFPIEVMPSGDGAVVMLFAPDGAGITLADKEAAFHSTIGPLELKVKFVLKEMIYRGELAI